MRKLLFSTIKFPYAQASPRTTDLGANLIFCSSSKQYVSPSDNITSPCTAKINALRNKQVSKLVSSLLSDHFMKHH